MVNNTGKLRKWWKTCLKNARQHGRNPMLILKQNGWPILILTRIGHLDDYHEACPEISIATCYSRNVDISSFDKIIQTDYMLGRLP